jgi:hypothetical protein
MAVAELCHQQLPRYNPPHEEIPVRSLSIQPKTLLPALLAILFSGTAAAQINGLCNTGLTPKTASGCTAQLVTPNPPGGGSIRDGNWTLAYPYPSTLQNSHAPCLLKQFEPAWVDTPSNAWMPNSASTASEWITPYDGEGNQPQGWYVYATAFPVPAVLLNGGVPTGLAVLGQLAVDNFVYGIYLESPAFSDRCELVSGQQFPIGSFTAWTNFAFNNRFELTAGEEAILFFVVENAPGSSFNPTGLRVEFFDSSAFF